MSDVTNVNTNGFNQKVKKRRLCLCSFQPHMQGYPGQIHANIGPVKTNVTFDHRDCGVTLLKNDHVLINLLVDMVTGKRRAANIKPKIPFTFSYTKEKRELVTHLFADRPSLRPVVL